MNKMGDAGHGWENMNIKRISIFGFAALIILAGSCTRALKVDYRPGVGATPARPSVLTLGVAQFKDERSWIEVDDEHARSFVAQEGVWKFGLSRDGDTYLPVADFVRGIFVQEFNGTGIKATAVGGTTAASETGELVRLCKTANVDYVLGGKILTFEFVNETGLLTVTSRRAVALALSLVNKAGMPVLSNSLITESQREFEGLGILHSTNVDKLVNDVFKKVVRQAIDQVSVKLEVDVREVSVQTADAKVLHFAVNHQQQLVLATTDIVAENRSNKH